MTILDVDNNSMHFRLWLAFLTALALTLSWDLPALIPIKLLVVYVHEVSHGMVALLSGAYLEQINLTMDEWGETLVRDLKGSSGFIFTVSAGYLGSIFTGSFLLNRGLTGKLERLSLGIFAFFLLYSGYLFTEPGSLSFFTSLGWSLTLFLVCFLQIKYVRTALVLLGMFFIWYCFYDLFDFTSSIEHTDAGIIARYLVDHNTFLGRWFSESNLSLIFSGAWSIIIVASVVLSFYLSIKSDIQPLILEETNIEQDIETPPDSFLPTESEAFQHRQEVKEPILVSN